jgi:hypothetical protein
MTGKTQSIILGSLIVGLLATLFGLIQYNVQSQVLGTVACCLIPTVGALVATWHYTSTNAITIRAGEGAMMGLAAGIIGYFVSLILSVLVSFTGLVPSPFDVDAVIEITQNTMVESGSSDEEIETAIGFIEQFFYLFIVIAVVTYALIGAVVGAIGANIFKHGSPETELTE